MPNAPRAPEYHEDVDVRWVKPRGEISWQRKPLHLTSLLAGQPVGIHQIDEDEWEVHYGPVLLGYILIRDGKPVLERAA